MRLTPALFVSSLLALTSALAPACSSEDPELDVDAGDTDPESPPNRDAGARDASVRDARADATRNEDADVDPESDAEADAEVDAGTSTPEPGDPCSPVGSRYERACGVCGTQVAVCGTDGVVSGYGACLERHPAFCAGDGGQDAGRDAGADAGEDASVDAGAEDAGAEDASVDASEPVDPWAGYSIDIDGAVGATKGVTMADADGQRRRLSVIDRRTCPATFPASNAVTDYALVRIRNRTAQTATVELSVARGVGLGPVDTILAVYAAPPADDDALLACLGTAVRGTCTDPAGGGYGLSCLLGASAPVVPAGAEIYAYVGMATNPWNGPALNATLTNLQ